MTTLKTVSVTEFKARCFELISEVSRTGESLVLTKWGRPIAMVTPTVTKEATRWLPGSYDGKIKIVGDIVAPLNEPWESLA